VAAEPSACGENQHTPGQLATYFEGPKAVFAEVTLAELSTVQGVQDN